MKPVLAVTLGDVAGIGPAHGFLFILYVLATAARLYFADPTQLAPLTRMPLSLLPTYFVPLIALVWPFAR